MEKGKGMSLQMGTGDNYKGDENVCSTIVANSTQNQLNLPSVLENKNKG